MKSIVIYFSRAGENYSVGNISKGNTEIIAEFISDITNSPIFKIEPLNDYPTNYNECVEIAKDEFEQNDRPKVKEYLESIDEYDTIYLGYPNWWGTMPMCVYTFLEHYNFDGKTIKPFCTHEGSGLGASISDLKKLLPNTTIKNGMAIQGSRVKSAKVKVENWISGK